ncbi:MAG: tRNA 5-methoxyuridine(34)/uridine 5-oxyacetic acid(34) synthase CmoB [Gammaproteobacteria bacterium]|nr:tRNA 5-methoxyuridine(34)/uridine 5-oxyacetic acid(34) synthase CmoB [Gammaproteobacteria bacterium]
MNYELLYAAMQEYGLEKWLNILPEQIKQGLDEERYGDLTRWQKALERLPEISLKSCDFNASAVTVRPELPLSQALADELKDTLKQLMPWRKGPYEIHGVNIDTEWRSDWKWQRLEQHIQPLAGRVVLDVGCGNGYHGWRMLGAGAELVMGIDPSPLFVMQYQAVKHFTGEKPLYVLPLGIEAVPEKLNAFDTVFSMGVLYHRRSPIDHLIQLRDCLKSGGELVLETLVIEGNEQQVLVPQGRYAKMRNVWFIPSCDALELWLARCGFKNIQQVDLNVTSLDEQRSTEWMQYESLKDYLNPANLKLTVEGYPAPQRVVIIATAP